MESALDLGFLSMLAPSPLYLIILIAIGAILGFTRGIARQGIRFATVIISLFLSLYLAKVFSGSVITWLSERSPEEIRSFLSGFGLSAESSSEILYYVDSETINHIVAIPLGFVVTPIIFVIFFSIVSVVTLIPAKIISGIFGLESKDKKNGITSRLTGMLAGAVQSIVVTMILFVPIIGIFNTVDASVETLREETSEGEMQEFIEAYDTGLKETTQSGTVCFMSGIGGGALYESLATVTINETSYNMPNEVAKPIVKLLVSTSGLADVDWTALTPENETAINEIINAFRESEYASTLVTDVLLLVTRAHEGGAIELEFEAPMDEIANATFTVIKNIAIEAKGADGAESLARNISTLTEAYYILSREGVLKTVSEDSKETLDALMKTDANGDTTVKKVVSVLNSNSNTVPIVTVLSKVSVAALADQLGTDADITELYDNVKTGVNETLAITKENKTEEEYIAEVSTSLDKTLKDNGIELEKEIVDEMATYVSDNYDELSKVDSDGDGQLSDQEVNDIILSYYDAYLKYMENNGSGNVDLPGGVEIPDDMEIPGGFEIPDGFLP